MASPQWSRRARWGSPHRTRRFNSAAPTRARARGHARLEQPSQLEQLVRAEPLGHARLDLRRQLACDREDLASPHTVRNESAAEARAYVVFAPGEEFERFARAASGLSVPDDVLRLAERHGIEMTRPVPAAA